jgi:hypothetical protein
MIVQFEIDLPDGHTLTESDLTYADSKTTELLANMDRSPEGGLVFSDPATGQSTAVGDTLGALIQSLCFQSIASLAAARVYSTHLFAYPEQVTLTPDGDQVIVTGTELDPSRYAKRELLPALVACGERYASFLRKLHGDDPEMVGGLENIESAAKAARAQLPTNGKTGRSEVI